MRELWRLLPAIAGYTIPVRTTPKQRHNKEGRTPLSTFVFEREVVAPLASEAWRQAPTSRPVGLVYDFYFFTHEPDLTNSMKSIEDGMNGIVYIDDKQVKYSEICMNKCANKNDERLEIQILVM